MDVPSVAGLVKHWRSSEKVWLPVWKDSQDRPIMNKAKQLPIKPYHDIFSVGVYHFIVFKQLPDAAYKSQLNSTNINEWRSWQPGQAWISEIHTSGVMQIGSGTGEQVHYVIRCIDKPNGWSFEHPNVGYLYKDGVEYKAFVDDTETIAYIGKLTPGGDKLVMDLDLEILKEAVKKPYDFTNLGF